MEVLNCALPSQSDDIYDVNKEIAREYMLPNVVVRTGETYLGWVDGDDRVELTKLIDRFDEKGEIMISQFY